MKFLERCWVRFDVVGRMKTVQPLFCEGKNFEELVLAWLLLVLPASIATCVMIWEVVVLDTRVCGVILLA